MQLQNKRVLVIGLGLSGVAATWLLAQKGASVLAVDNSDNEALKRDAAQLQAMGVEVRLGVSTSPDEPFDLVVTSPGVPWENPILAGFSDQTNRPSPHPQWGRGKTQIIGELELAFRFSQCPSIAITGTNGKTTTTELVERILLAGGRRTIAAGNIGRPFSDVVEKTAELDFVTLEVSSFQLETIQTFRPVIGLLMNITPDHLDRYPSMAEYIRAKGRLFENQTSSDSAVIQSEALKLLVAQKIHIPSRIVTFSAADLTADFYANGNWLESRLTGCSETLIDMRDCQLRGPHNAENLLATLAVGHLVGLPLEKTVEALKTYQPAAHRCELVAEVKGVKFVNDSKATNVDAVQKALLTVADPQRPNVWLIAGGKDKRFDYSEIGPVLAKRVKGAFLIGETREKIFFAWNEFISCTRVESLLEAFRRAADCAVAGDVVLLSPACSSFDQFRNYQHRGEVFRQAVAAWREEVTGRPVRRSRENGSAVLMM